MSDQKNSNESKAIIKEAIADVFRENLKKQEKDTGVKNSVFVFDPMPVGGAESNAITSILGALKKSEDIATVQRLSLEVDPHKDSLNYNSLFRRRNNLIPPPVLKRLRDTEELLGGVILPTRARQLLMFSRPRANRFDVGFAINIKPEALNRLSEKDIEQYKIEVIPRLREMLLNCGHSNGLTDANKRTLGQFMMESSEDANLFGWFAAEVRKDDKGNFHSFRAVDAGTIYQVSPKKQDAQDAENVRKQAERLIKEIYGEKVDSSLYNNFKDKYTWVQVIDDIPQQVFTDDELLVMNINPSTDIYRNGYPVSPIERIVQAITTHINLTTHNKMYFVNGKAARNVMVFKSDNLEPQDIEAIKNQMQAHINSVNSAWRMPVFGMGANDDVSVMPLEGGGRDMEFQYLADLNKRMIFAAFQMSPDEVAALSYLSRGTNSQSLAEANNEWKLIAARDTGLRPLLMMYEDFFNERLLPKINPEWAKILRIDLEGLDADSPEKEATRLQQDSNIYLTMNDIMERVEKQKVPVGGDLPLNGQFVTLLERYFTKGEILKAFGGEKYKDADKDPSLQYCIGDPTSTQIFMMQAQMQMQAAMQGQQQPPDDQGGEGQGGDLDSALKQLNEALGKSESKLPTSRKELLKRHKIAKKKIMKDFEEETSKMIDSIEAALSGKDPHKHED